MILGHVNQDFVPVIELLCIGTNQLEAVLNLEIDTGFNGGLTLTIGVINSLGWPFRRLEVTTLGDGSKQLLPTYRGLVIWNGELKFTQVSSSHSQCLLGTELMKGHRLTIDFQNGG